MLIHGKEVNEIVECNLLYDIINTPKRAKRFIICLYHILHGCMNTRRGEAKFKNFRILLDSGCSFKIEIGKLVGKRLLGKDAMMEWNTQAESITTNLKVKVYFTLPTLSATNVVTWKFHLDDSAKGRYNMI